MSQQLGISCSRTSLTALYAAHRMAPRREAVDTFIEHAHRRAQVRSGVSTCAARGEQVQTF